MKLSRLHLCAVLISGLLCACGPEQANEARPGPPPEPPAGVLVLGVDGMEWDVVLPLLEKGELPALEALMRRGRYGFLRSMRPTQSPIIWTTIATSKGPEEHGIEGFIRRDSAGLKRLYNRTDRRTKAIWNIFSESGYRTSVIGYWMSWPVEPIKGLMVAQTNTAADLERTRIWKGSLSRGRPAQVHPPERLDEMLAIASDVESDLPGLSRRVLGDHAGVLAPLDAALLESSLWALRADEVYAQIAEAVLSRDAPYDLQMVYLGGPDVFGHRFWRYLEPGRYTHPPGEDALRQLGAIIPRYYRYIDAILGRLVQRLPENSTIVVLSDHGMRAWQRELDFDGVWRAADGLAGFTSGHHLQAPPPPGVLVVAGPWVQAQPGSRPVRSLARSDLRELGSVYDITPTLLAMYRIPRGSDMRGQVLADLFRPEVRILEQPGPLTWHDERWTPVEAALDARALRDEAERLEQLRGLGYLEGK